MSRIEDGGAVEAGLEKLAGRAKSWSLGTNRARVTVPLGEIRAALGEITRLRAENSGMRTEITRKNEALKPFADEVFRYEPDEDDDNDIAWSSDFSIGDLRRARAALSNSSQAEGGAG